MSDWYSDDPIEEVSARPNKSKSFFAVALLIINGYFLQSTFAGNISLSSGTGVEFGQGVLQAVACDKAVTLTPQSSFANAAGAGGYNFSTLIISNLDSSLQGCAGKTLTFKAYGDTGTALATFSIAIASDGSYSTSDGTLSSQGVQGASSSVTITLSSTVASSNIYKITLESLSTILTCATGGTCVVGDIGPGGGIIFYVDNVSGFNCGPTFTATCRYLEVAPAGWNGGSDPLSTATNTAYQSTAVPGIVSRNPVFNDPSEIGLGYQYTLAFIAQGNDGTTAPGQARAYNGGSKTDWYLPTTSELNLLCRWNRGQAQSASTVCNGGTMNSGTGASGSGFIAEYYHTSSQANSTSTWVQQFGTVNGAGNQGAGLKRATYRVRPIRAF
jgi:hypothetical protein